MSILSKSYDFVVELAKHRVYEITIATLIGLGSVFHTRLWRVLNNLVLNVTFRCRVRISRIGLKLVTLDDYVALLDQLRNKLDRFCQRDSKFVVQIYVLTMQLPRDWPLWASESRSTDSNKTALEEYFYNFLVFLQEIKRSQRTVDVKRIIVIENCDSPAGLQKLADLRADVNSGSFKDYLEMLHENSSQALLYKHTRPWPGWLSDAVFYGIKEGQKATNWLWGVTTSYRAGEDLLLLRFHRKTGKKLNKRLIFPWGARSLVGLLDKIPGFADEGKLTRLTDLKSPNNGPGTNPLPPLKPPPPSQSSPSLSATAGPKNKVPKGKP